jgi:sigma-E factor negative regulatory protein RseA
MKTRISALMDGELESHEITETLHVLRDTGALHTEFAAYQVIGDALRGEPNLDMDVSARVMAAIEREPAVVLLASRRALRWQRPAPALALAASAAGVALVAWVALTPVAGSDSPGMVAGTVAKGNTVSGEVVAVNDPASRLRMQEYLVAHQVYAPGGAIAGSANPVRAVSITYEGR